MYATQSCNPYAKVFYRPVDAAIRWCNLMAYETQILEVAWRSLTLLGTAFPQWPCLHANTEKIFDAIQHGELPYGCLGIPVAIGTHVDCLQVTIRHTDFKLWMSRFHPALPIAPPSAWWLGAVIRKPINGFTKEILLQMPPTTFIRSVR